MTLPEAIRLGAMLKPQKFGGPAGKLTTETHTCALSAASEAIGLTELCCHDPVMSELTREYRKFFVLCPAHGCDRLSGLCGAVSLVPHLNDIHFWSRERIADWLETLVPPTRPVEQPEEIPVTA